MTYQDTYDRPIRYLRVSLTDRCNLRCVYCMPEEGVSKLTHEDILRYEEIVRVVRVAVGMGITHVRLTGGEPLVRGGIVDLVHDLARIPGLDDLSLTTNGLLLPRYAEELARAGLKRINLSLDTLQPERFRHISRLGELNQVLAGREAALAAGLKPVKVNVVMVRGMNDDEIVDLARLTLAKDWHVRFIEVMPLGAGEVWTGNGVVSAREMRSRIESALGALEPVAEGLGVGIGPARYYRLSGGEGTVGFISPVSDHFCQSCNRLRLTSNGLLLPCLMSNAAVDLRMALRNGVADEELRELLLSGIIHKPQGHHLADLPECLLPMSCIGG